ncbi:MAG: signal peptidase I [Pseudomonadota bacterium]
MDFSVVLVVLVGISGLIWLLDALWLGPARRKLAEARDGKAREQALREPWPVEYARSFFPVLAIVLVLRSFVIEPFQIPSGSMEPTLEVGDFILVNKYTYGLRLPVLGTKLVSINEPQRGEVMVFFPPHDSRYFIKRVIGLPGDRIEYEAGRLTINDQPVETTLVEEIEIDTSAGAQPGLLYEEQLGEHTHLAQVVDRERRRPMRTEWVVPPGHYFMMGDNRDNSADSRVWGAVPEENIVGRAFAVWLHKDPGWNLPTFSRNGSIE